VISVPVRPVRSTGHLGSTQPDEGEGDAVLEVLEDSTVEEAVEDWVTEGEVVEVVVDEVAVAMLHSAGMVVESLYGTASTPRPREAKAFQRRHLLVPA
jgi:hypothetical protein